MSFMDGLDNLLMIENILPINDINWYVFKIDHQAPVSDSERTKQYEYIRSKVGDKAGIYIYKKENNVLYIGKAAKLFDRIKSHYIESFSTVSGDRSGRWHAFFSNHENLQSLEIFWKEFKDEEERQIIEYILTKKYKPTFLKFKI